MQMVNDEILEEKRNWKKTATSWVQYKDGSVGVKYHNTVVIRKYVDGSVVLNSGGWQTRTTKERINTDLHLGHIQQANNEWFYVFGEKRIRFFDGMRIDKNGDVAGAPLAKLDKIAGRNRQLKARIAKFVKKIDKMSREELKPSSGDCLFCSMFERSGMQTDNSHLEEHLKEGYMHGSLIMNALKEAGYAFPEIIMHMDNKESMKRAVSKYMYKRLVEKPVV